MTPTAKIGLGTKYVMKSQELVLFLGCLTRYTKYCCHFISDTLWLTKHSSGIESMEERLEISCLIS